MKRTISAMVGQGSVNHNSRKFHAKNTDPERSHLNITYCQENIKAVYHELFDEALERYNAKQTRADRRIEDYYAASSSISDMEIAPSDTIPITAQLGSFDLRGYEIAHNEIELNGY